MKKVVFTICAKNYLAQALTLKESCLKHNKDVDFQIFLADKVEEENIPKESLVLLDESWISYWKQMAFKYNVIEFSTSVKPFCFNKLFKEGYDKVIYLDPDIYVTDSLDTIFDYLDHKSIVLSPHYCHIQENYTGSVPEEELLFVGIYNLGFCAIKNGLIGKKIIKWWMNRLEDKCYADKIDALHVDQRWMDFIPAFFPNDTYITQHPGINPAIWNLHERELLIYENKYYIKDLVTKQEFPLLFFHFSGFDPFNEKVLNRRHPKYNTDIFPSYIPLIKEYIKAEYRNGYELYSKMIYSFNAFNDGENIMPIHRRLFRIINDSTVEDPFQQNSNFRNILKKNKLLSNRKTYAFSSLSPVEKKKKGKVESTMKGIFFLLKKIVGIRFYSSFISFLGQFVRFENQTFLIRRK